MTIPFIEPFRIKVVEKVRMTTREEREAALKAAHYNLFAVKAEDVFIDLLTDSGTGAMSDEQWAGMMRGDESYAGAKSYFRFEKAVQEIMGFPYVLPTHQGRAAEGMLFQTLVKAGQTVPNNRHFDTTMGNLQVLGANPVDVPVPESDDTVIDLPFKGNMDLEKLEALIQKIGVENIPLGMLTITNNSAAGQPVSMENIRGTAEIYHRHGIPFFIDACRFGENAWFIKIRDPKYKDVPVREIVREMFSYADGCTMSAKKDGMVNIGGFIGFRDPELKEQIGANLIVHEGFLTYGGLAGRDLEAIAVGLNEVVEDDYLNYRESHTRYLGEVLSAAGMPVYKPTGGHAVYVDAGKAFPSIPKQQFPGVALANALYLAGGIRTVEIGSMMFEHLDPVTGEAVLAPLELVRFAIPRRVYTRSHLDYIGEVAAECMQHPELVKGLRITWAPKVLRHFMARLEEVG
ncbi:MAG: tryptophanase [Anaerolineaceae bacterium]